MVYGYAARERLNEHGLMQMSEVSIQASPDALRALGNHLIKMADEAAGQSSPYWHEHLPMELTEMIGCDVIVVLPPDGTGKGERGER